MKFEVGDMVWIGWAPNHWVRDLGDDPRNLQGTLIDFIGPFDFKYVGTQNKWEIATSIGVVEAAESLLIKIPPEEAHGRKTTKKNQKRPETV